MEPKVFVSHASEDKQRFVLNFAEKLRSQGIDAWIDRWEMLPGDSLVDKIFEEGIKNAQAVIIVISKNSIKKPWVREELNASMVKKISTGSKLIPIVLDNCDVPECLKSTVWEPINNINNYDAELRRIIMSIYGMIDKPPIGEVPRYVNTMINQFPNLTKIDSILFKIVCENAIKRNDVDAITSQSIFEEVSKLNIGYSEFLESLEILYRRNYIKGFKTISGDIPLFDVTVHGFDQYVRMYVNGFEDIVKKTCFYIVNNQGNNIKIASELNKPLRLINHVFELLKLRRLINFEHSDGEVIFLYDVSPELKRMLQ